MKFHQGVVLTRHPEAEMEAATKWYVDKVREDLSVESATAIGLFVTNVTSSSGIVNEKQYAQGTVPADVVILEATTDQDTVRIHFLAEGDSSFYSPTVLVDTTYPGSPDLGNIAGVLTQDPNDLRTFHGYADVDVADVPPEGRLITLVSTTSGSTASVLIKRAAEPPVIQTLIYGTVFPTDPFSGNPQTTLKGGDTFTVTGTVENSASIVTLSSNVGSVTSGTFTTATTGGTLGGENSGGAGYRSFTIRYTVTGSRSGAQTAQAFAANQFGSAGPTATTSNTVTLDQTSPVIGARSVSYPGTQQALKNSETATVTSSITNYTDVVYSTTGGTITVTGPTVYSASKTVTRVGGDYVYNANNYRITAYKTSNGSSSTATASVNISNVAPTVAITGASSRLISSPTGVSTQITLTFNQRLLSAPAIVSSGDATAGDRSAMTIVGGAPSNIWRFNINVDDADIKGTYNWTVNGVRSLSDNTYNALTITSGNQYTIGGFTSRTFLMDITEQVAILPTWITDPTKVVVSYTDSFTLGYKGADLSMQLIGWSTLDESALVAGVGVPGDPGIYWSNFVFQDASITPTKAFFLTDSDFAGANTTGSLSVTIREDA